MSEIGGGLLERPGDEPSEHEEAVISKIKTDREQRFDEIHTAIARAHHRQQVYLSKGDMRSAEIEGEVKDRRLNELDLVMTPDQRRAADQRVLENSDEWRNSA